MILVNTIEEWNVQKNKRGLTIVPLSFPLMISTGQNEIIYLKAFGSTVLYSAQAEVEGVIYEVDPNDITLVQVLNPAAFIAGITSYTNKFRCRVVSGTLLNQYLTVKTNKLTMTMVPVPSTQT